jgi:predicted RND superfamily exporter protein
VKKKDRISIALVGLLMVVGVLLMWFTHHLFLRNFGLLLWMGAFICLIFIVFRRPSLRKK